MRHNHFGGNKVKKNLKIFLITLAVLVLLAGSFVLLIMHDFDDEVSADYHMESKESSEIGD